MEDLLGDEVDAMVTPTISEHSESSRRGRSLSDWLPSDGTPLSIAPNGNFRPLSTIGSDEVHFKVESSLSAKSNGHESIYFREGELMSKLHDLLHSPVGEGIARIVEEFHAILPRSRPLN